jgi:hypothetical protein
MARIGELHFSNGFTPAPGGEDYIEITLDPGEEPAGFLVSCYVTDGRARSEVALTDDSVLMLPPTEDNCQHYVISATWFPEIFAPRARNLRVAAVALTERRAGKVISFENTRANSPAVVAVDGAAAGAMSAHSNATPSWGGVSTPPERGIEAACPPIAKVPTTGGLACFAAGTRIRTDVGHQQIETLKEGALIWSRDNGPQRLQWLGRRCLPARGRFAPIQIAYETFGALRPHLVAPDHLILLTGWRAELLYGAEEILVPAKALVDNCDVRVSEAKEITYFHLAFDAPQIVSGDGVLSQCFHPDAQADALCAQAGRAEMFAHFPELATQVHVYGRNPNPTSKASLGPLLMRSG